ncbi:MAG: hypothetical protein BWY86_01306 [Candidatus Aminicenantes bacterium ADurb.Bin508]|nr:MAG: hypothetical protein BWY86_01306 [Candidatus Aminicenantes bacterium ADurb.Bin508]
MNNGLGEFRVSLDLLNEPSELSILLLNALEVDEGASGGAKAALVYHQLDSAQKIAVRSRLGDEDPVCSRGGVDSGVGVGSDDQIQLGEAVGQFFVLFVPDMGEEDQNPASPSGGKDLGQTLRGAVKDDSFDVLSHCRRDTALLLPLDETEEDQL